MTCFATVFPLYYSIIDNNCLITLVDELGTDNSSALLRQQVNTALLSVSG